MGQEDGTNWGRKRMWDLKRGQEVSPLQGMSSMFGTKGICWDLALSAKKSAAYRAVQHHGIAVQTHTRSGWRLH